MRELQLVRVQKLARRCITSQFLQSRRLPPGVNVVPCNRKPKMLEVHADLMRSPRMQNRFDQSSGRKTLDDTVSRARFPPVILIDCHGQDL